MAQAVAFQASLQQISILLAAMTATSANSIDTAQDLVGLDETDIEQSSKFALGLHPY